MKLGSSVVLRKVGNLVGCVERTSKFIGNLNFHLGVSETINFAEEASKIRWVSDTISFA